MERIQKIWNHPLYQELFALLQQAEQGRIFCGHTLAHFLDVARLAWIHSLENGAGLEKELIYGAALLHDIGRYEQLTAGTPHHEASARIAGEILPDCGFSREETSSICSAILEHRGAPEASRSGLLSEYLYRADKESRCCYACPAEPRCDWDMEKKNKIITL